MRLLAATGNAHKLEEIRRILIPLGISVEAPDRALLAGIVEDGATFDENARIKAMALFRRTGTASIADDSGLCVDALDGRPGVHSARYLGEGTPHSEKMRGILEELDGVPEHLRTARFVCSVCCVLDEERILQCAGVCEGTIGHAPAGDGGFGYDPIFLVEGRSFGELPADEKDRLSHRGRGLRAMAGLLAAALGEADKDARV